MFFNTLRNLPNTKKQSNCKIAFSTSKLLSKSIFVDLPTQGLQNITDAVALVASMDQNRATEQTHFSRL